MWLLPEKVPDLQRHYLDSVGRAPVLAQSFEMDCKYVLMVWDLGKAYKEGKMSLAEFASFSEKLVQRMLGTTVRGLGDIPDVTQDQIDTLSKAKDARNFIAHEGIRPCLYQAEGSETLLGQLRRYRANVELLAEGHNLVAGWAYAIEYKKPPPYTIRTTYQQTMVRWIMSPILDSERVR